MPDIPWGQQHSWPCTTTGQILGKSKSFNCSVLMYAVLSFRVRLANFLAPVASETNMGGPLGWIAGFGIDGIVDVSEDTLTILN